VFALVLTAISLGAALSAPPEDDKDTTTEAAKPPREPPPASVTVAFRHPSPEKGQVRRVRSGAHVVLTVSGRVPGDVEIPGLGLIEALAPGTPAVFDVLASRPGRYDVLLVSLSGERSRVGTLIVEG
jgi:hypothetical protein